MLSGKPLQAAFDVHAPVQDAHDLDAATAVRAIEKDVRTDRVPEIA
ncbi:MAG TPA: hypothetical protein VNW90_30325 [Acetobacteraceae bacterium]|nr:hypothetical protein [Acetobacteraceae bacterium]